MNFSTHFAVRSLVRSALLLVPDLYKNPIKSICLAALICFSGSTVTATTYKSIANGNWTASGTWENGMVPGFDIASGR